jgi:membrane protein implicated in regulation of membrane protease activity
MSIGASIFLIVVGAIFAFAVHANLGWLDLQVVGWVLMLAGVAGLVITQVVRSRRRRARAITQREIIRPGHAPQVVEERVYEDVQPPIPGEPGPPPAHYEPRS